MCVRISPSRCLLGSAFRFRDCSIQEWYGDLTTESSFEDFQNFFFKERTLAGVCEAPACPGCRTAVRGEKCYEDVKWALHTGIPQHPDAQAWKGVCPFHCVSSIVLSKNMSNEIYIIHFLKACCLLSRTTPHDWVEMRSGTMASQHQALLKRFRNFFGRKTSTTIVHDLVSHCAAPTVTAAPWASTSLVSMASVMRLQ